MCKDEFDRKEFLTPKGNRQTYCRPCRAIWFRRYRYLKKYGITVEQYDEMFAAQEGKCAICEREDEGRGREFLHIDHCHDTGRVRGLLCFFCNSGLGKFRDDPKLLLRAIDYLK